MASQVALGVNNPLANAVDLRDTGSIPGSGRSPEGGNGNPLQFSCLENVMDKGAWQATVHRVTQSQTQLKWLRHLTPVLLPGKSHGRRSLVGCRPWGRWGSDTTERLHFHFSLSRIGEGNGNPLQCSCLEIPRDGAAWWAAVYGVAQSQTRLKWLSSSTTSQPGCWHGSSQDTETTLRIPPVALFRPS